MQVYDTTSIVIVTKTDFEDKGQVKSTDFDKRDLVTAEQRAAYDKASIVLLKGIDPKPFIMKLIW